MTPTQEIERGRLAADVLTNQVFEEAWDTVEQEITTRWRSEEDARQREWLWTLLQASRKFKSVLTETVQTGQVRAKALEVERSRAERLGQTLSRPFRR